ncbi:LOW QUALITY PROTEIN: syntabulin-like [Cariama cristata]
MAAGVGRSVCPAGGGESFPGREVRARRGATEVRGEPAPVPVPTRGGPGQRGRMLQEIKSIVTEEPKYCLDVTATWRNLHGCERGKKDDVSQENPSPLKRKSKEDTNIATKRQKTEQVRETVSEECQVGAGKRCVVPERKSHQDCWPESKGSSEDPSKSSGEKPIASEQLSFGFRALCRYSGAIAKILPSQREMNVDMSPCGSEDAVSRKVSRRHPAAEESLCLKITLGSSRSEADFSSSSSTGSISAPEVHVSAAGSKRSSFSCNHGPSGHNKGSLPYKLGASPPASQEKDPSTQCKKQLGPANTCQDYRASSVSSSDLGSDKGSDSSPVRRQSGRNISCGDNLSIKPQNPEQDLPPLKQKEVTVGHLITKLKESESKRKERETEELKAHLRWMKEDWIEEECNRVEAELAFWEARREIRELRQVLESMKNSLAEKDGKFRKYFLDVSIENKKLESLLRSMEMAQNSSVRGEQCLEYTCGSDGKLLALCAMMPDNLVTEDRALEELADGGLLLIEGSANGTNSEESLITAASKLSDAAPSTSAVNPEMLEDVVGEELTSCQEEEKISNVGVEQTVQTDVVPYSSDVEQLIQNIFRAQGPYPLSPPSSLEELGEFSLRSVSGSGITVDLTPSDPNTAVLLSPVESPCMKIEHRVNKNHFMKELDFTEPHDDETFGDVKTFSETGIKKRYWSSSLLRGLLAVAAPVVPTLLWALSTRGGGTNPIYKIGVLLCGCCLVALHSLHHSAFNIRT